MISPAVAFIEIAAYSLKQSSLNPLTDNKLIRESQEKEIRCFGRVRAKELGASDLTNDFLVGYRLGIETARIIINSIPAAVQANIEL